MNGTQWLLKLQSIYQPKNPLFWCMLALNVLSFALSWIVQNRSLNTLGLIVVASFALVNGALGMWLMWRLMQTRPDAPTPSLDK